MEEKKLRRPGATLFLSIAMILVGIVMIIRTESHGGGPAATGLILGVLFIAAGIGRLYLQLRMMRNTDRHQRD